MSRSSVIWVAFMGFAISCLLIPLILRYSRPSTRRQFHHTHGLPICRFGGLAIAVPFLAITTLVFLLYPVAAARSHDRWIIVGSSLTMFLLGLIDDAWPLGAKRKQAGQILIASAVYYFGIQIGSIHNPLTGVDYLLGGWGYFATVFWLVAFTNLINLIDGVDGLAAGIALMVMGLLLYVGFQSDLVFPALCAAGVCGALIGFLRYNFPPATIYLGDGGAYFLGFLIGLLSMVHSQKGSVAAALLAPLFVLALPIVDVTLAIVRRGLKGLPVFRPDRRHLHHRLAEAGLSRTRIVLGFYSCTLFFLLLAFVVFVSQGRWLAFSFGVGCVVLLISAHSFSFSREWFSIGKVLGNSLELRKQTRYALALRRWLELEVQRAASPEGLWSDFIFIVKKLGFSSVTLQTAEGRKRWEGMVTGGVGKGSGLHRVRCDLTVQSWLEFSAPARAMNRRTFELLSELSAETWLKSAQQWQGLHQGRWNLRPDAAARVNQTPALLKLPLSKSEEPETA